MLNNGVKLSQQTVEHNDNPKKEFVYACKALDSYCDYRVRSRDALGSTSSNHSRFCERRALWSNAQLTQRGRNPMYPKVQEGGIASSDCE
jgi:hypothetical protein